jgi:hypothetical protein
VRHEHANVSEPIEREATSEQEGRIASFFFGDGAVSSTAIAGRIF